MTDPARSLLATLAGLAAACVLPGLFVSGYLVYEDYRNQKAMLRNESMAYTKAIAAALDRDLSSIEANLLILATHPLLTSGAQAELPAFHRLATDSLPLQEVNSYVLLTPQGKQLVNTLRPWGAPLPAAGAPPRLLAVFELERPVLSDLFIGPVTGKPVVAMGVPVRRGGRVAYSLNAGIFPERLRGVMSRVALPRDWIAVIIDSTGTVVARTHEMGRFVGHKAVPLLVKHALQRSEGALQTDTLEGIPVSITFSRSSVSSWTVAIGVPREILESGLRRSFAQLLGVSGALLGLGLALAWRRGRRIARSIERLSPLAARLGEGQPVPAAATGLRETDRVADALRLAAAELQRAQHRAHHDALTGLANRTLLELRLEQQAQAAAQTRAPFCLLRIDLDGFREVNNRHGRSVGDRLLQEAAHRLTVVTRASDTAARLGGDAFGVLLADSTLERAQAVAAAVLASMRRPFLFEDLQVSITASIGMAGFPESTPDPADLPQQADRALAQARRGGPGRSARPENAVPATP